MEARLALTLGLVAVLAIAPLALAFVVTGYFVKPPWYAHNTPAEGLRSLEGNAFAEDAWQGVHRDPRVDFGADFEEVEFPAQDGSTLRGGLVPSGAGSRAGVVAVHGIGADRREYLRTLPVFRDAGYPLLLFDWRDHGISDGEGRGANVVRSHEDVISAVAFMKCERGFERVAVTGVAGGAVAAIMAAGASGEIDAVIAENGAADLESWIFNIFRSGLGARVADQGVRAPSGFALFRLPDWWIQLVVRIFQYRAGGREGQEPINLVHKIAPRPLFLIHGLGDEAAPADWTQQLFERAGEPKQLWLAPDAGHEGAFNHHPEEWGRRIVAFLDASLRADPTPVAPSAARSAPAFPR